MTQEPPTRPLPPGESSPSFILYDYGQPAQGMHDCTIGIRKMFSSTSSWLYPLFEVEQYLLYAESRGKINRANYVIYDRMVGMASAYLILHLRISVVVTDMASVPAVALLRSRGVECLAESVVVSIGCRTEALCSSAQPALSIEEAYKLLSDRLAIEAESEESL